MDRRDFFPAHPVSGSELGQSAPPRNEQEWYHFIHAVCTEIARVVGPEAQKLRFRVGTENNSKDRFNGSHAQFVWHYDATAAAVASVLPQAEVGAFNISGASIFDIEHDNVRALDLAIHCETQPNNLSHQMPTRFDWVAFSRYFRPGEDAQGDAAECRDVWHRFDQVPRLQGVSREIHEFGIAPWGDAGKGIFVSAEPGVLGAALTSQLMLDLRQFGIRRLWHWSVYDEFRDRNGKLQNLYNGTAWVLSVLERMAHGNFYLLPCLNQSEKGMRHMVAASFKEQEAIFLVPSYSQNIANHKVETVRFEVPSALCRANYSQAQFVMLSQANSPHDLIRQDLLRAGLLKPNFQAQPHRVGNVREMGTGIAAERAVGDRLNDYTGIYTESLTLKPLDRRVGSINVNRDGAVFELRAPTPSIVAIVCPL